MSLLVPSHRKLKFACTCLIHELTNIPFLTGVVFCKWKLAKSTLKGSTERAPIIDNKVEWDAVFTFDCTLILGKDGILQPFEIIIMPKLEINGGTGSERLGYVTICLANLANSNKGPVKYLLQDAKSNSLLQISIQMSLIKGDRYSFKTPAPSSKTVSSLGTADNTMSRKNQTQTPLEGVNHSTRNRFSIERLNILESDTGDAELIDSFFAKAKEQMSLNP